MSSVTACIAATKLQGAIREGEVLLSQEQAITALTIIFGISREFANTLLQQGEKQE